MVAGAAVGAALRGREYLCVLCPVSNVQEAADCATPTLAWPGRTHPQAQSLRSSDPGPALLLSPAAAAGKTCGRGGQSPSPTALGATTVGPGQVVRWQRSSGQAEGVSKAELGPGQCDACTQSVVARPRL